MFKQLIFVVLCAELSYAASTIHAVPLRADPRVSSGSLSQDVPATAVHEQEQAGPKTTENGAATQGGVPNYAGFPGNPGHQPSPNAYAAPPTGMNSYSYPTGPAIGSPYSASNGNSILGLSSNGDVTFSAYFGPVFWGFVGGLAVGIVVVLIINVFGGFEYLGSAIRGIGTETEGKKSSKGRAIDLDHIASLVYAAMDKYNKWNADPKDNTY